MPLLGYLCAPEFTTSDQTMCISEEYLRILDELNERDFDTGKASAETYSRFRALFQRCFRCSLRENHQQGDALPECRQDFLRLFISMKNDMEFYLLNGPICDVRPRDMFQDEEMCEVEEVPIGVDEGDEDSSPEGSDSAL